MCKQLHIISYYHILYDAFFNCILDSTNLRTCIHTCIHTLAINNPSNYAMNSVGHQVFYWSGIWKPSRRLRVSEAIPAPPGWRRLSIPKAATNTVIKWGHIPCMIPMYNNVIIIVCERLCTLFGLVTGQPTFLQHTRFSKSLFSV